MNAAWIGFDPREADGYAVTRASLRRRDGWTRVFGLLRDDLRDAGLFTRPQEMRDGRIIDLVDGFPCATEFSLTRFLVPELARRRGSIRWAVFMDCDMLVRAPLAELFEQLDRRKALYCVQHDHRPAGATKMQGQVQAAYPRKNWSSLMIFNVAHPANRRLTVEMVNRLPGRDLHRFCWLADDEIGALPVEWNWLAGHSAPVGGEGPKIVHFTDGIPSMPGYENAPFADEWRAELRGWAR